MSGQGSRNEFGTSQAKNCDLVWGVLRFGAFLVTCTTSRLCIPLEPLRSDENEELRFLN